MALSTAELHNTIEKLEERINRLKEKFEEGRFETISAKSLELKDENEGEKFVLFTPENEKAAEIKIVDGRNTFILYGNHEYQTEHEAIKLTTCKHGAGQY